MDKRKTKTESVQLDWVFEVSWEVCNKVGGIYTVLKSKASQMVGYYQDKYYLIGPYFAERIKGEFQEEVPRQELGEVALELKKQGVKCYFGKWLIKGEPKVILLDFKDLWSRVNQIKAELWEEYKIDSLNTGQDFNEPVVWAYAAGMFLERISLSVKEEKIVAHFHEWLSGTGLLYLKKKRIKIGTVFTTHATTLGRALAYHNVDFYSILTKIDPEREAVKYNVKAKHQLEKQAAVNCHIFTTVSEITGLEARSFLKRGPDLLLPNGLDLEKFLTFEEIVIKHRIQRDRLREFLLFYFFPYYTFDLENTLFYFMIGRYEFHAKGIDILIKSLTKLNQKLIKNKSKKTIIVFFWVPTGIKGIKPELLENREIFQDIKDALKDVSWENEEKVLFSILERKKIREETLFEKDFLFEIKKKLLRLKRESLPPLATHDLVDSQDIIMKSFQEAGLLNKESDRVKVVFYPIYLTGYDGLSNLNYQECIQACHLGVFPSFYEPWGYTPLEAAALGVASITTDLSGFGRFCQKIRENKKQPGVFVLERFNKDEEKVVKSLYHLLYNFSQLSRQERVENKIQARKIAAKADWKFFIKNYLAAHKKACQ